MKLHTPCTTCGTILPINGLVTGLACPKCFTARNIESAVWKDIMRKSVNEGLNLPQGRPESFTWKTGNFSRIRSYHLEFANSLPEYDGGTAVDLDEVVQHSKAGYFIHPGSNRKISIRDFPGEFSNVMPPGKKIKHAPRTPCRIFVLGEDLSQISRPEPGSITLSVSDGIQALKCTECGGTLDVPGDNNNARCAHCGTLYFIPSALWQRLHPDKEIVAWFLLVE